MKRLYQTLFVVSLLAACWLGMQYVHELGHISAALTTGGRVAQVVMHPLAISSTEVSPNPQPGVVVWAGPVLGCLLPMLTALLFPRGSRLRTLVLFFAGFCLVANGAYIGLGASEGIGDCGVMRKTGTPLWSLWLFGGAAASAGLTLWHRLGSPAEFLRKPEWVSPRQAFAAAATAILLALLGTLVTGA